MNEFKKNKTKLNLKAAPKTPMTQEDAAQAMAEYYSVMGNCVLNLIPMMERIAFSMEQLLIEVSDIKDNYNRVLLDKGLLSQVDIAEREAEDEEPEGGGALSE